MRGTGQTPGGLREGLEGLPGGRLNVAHEAVERHAASDRRDRPALRWHDPKGAAHELTFAELERLARRFANVLEGMAIQPSQRVLALAPELPELYATALGALRYGAVFGVVPGDLPPDSLRAHLACAEARVLVTTASAYEREVRWVRDAVDALDYVILIGDDRGPTNVEHTLDWIGLVHDTEAVHRIAQTDPDDPALLCFEGEGEELGCRIHGHAAVLERHLALDEHTGGASFLDHLAPLTRGEPVVIP